MSYVTLRADTGVTLGAAWCEQCGQLSAFAILDGFAPRLRELADLHWVDPIQYPPNRQRLTATVLSGAIDASQ